jgi:1-deoxyxylulose-5-phosphate synthase
MQSAPLSGTGIQISQVILGCGSIGGVGSARDTWGRCGQSEAEAFEMLGAAVELGNSVVDTAVSYAGGEGETVIGRWLANRPSGVVVTTKAGGVVEAGAARIDLSRGNLSRQLPVSLEHLCSAPSSQHAERGVSLPWRLRH